MVAMGGDHTAPEYHFVHQQASHFVNLWYFYAFGERLISLLGVTLGGITFA